MIFAGVIAFIMAGMGMLEYQTMSDRRIITGVFVEDVYLGGQTSGNAMLLLQPLFQKVLSRNVTIRGGGKNWVYTPNHLVVKGDAAKTVNLAWQVGRRGNLWQRWQERWKARTEHIHISPVFVVDRNKIGKVLAALAEQIEVEPENARIDITPENKIKIIPEREGWKINRGKSLEKLDAVFRTPHLSEVSLVEEKVFPPITGNEIKNWQITGVVAFFETQFNTENKERSDNIKVAAEALDKSLVMPDRVFSFNDIVGPRTTEKGYKESLVIENNQFTPGVGGGVCQVSTTLYNALLRANLTIVERHPHSLPISYVAPGLDATVSYNWVDLKFMNNYPKPVLIHTEYKPGKLKILVLGTEGKFPQVRITSRIVKHLAPEKKVIEDASVPPGEEVIEKKGQEGLITEVKREFLEDGQVIASEIISRDKYQPQKKIVRVAPKG